MKKSFKRAIAVLLTVLMAVFSMPFSALAYNAVDGPTADIDIQARFSPIFDTTAIDDDGTFVDFKGADSIKGNNTIGMSYAGLKGPALTYKNGYISLNPTTISGWMADNDVDDANFVGDLTDPDYLKYGTGDVFALTWMLNGMKTFFSEAVVIEYHNIEPVVAFGYGKAARNAKSTFAWHTYAEYAEALKKQEAGDENYKNIVTFDGINNQGILTNQSSAYIYGDIDFAKSGLDKSYYDLSWAEYPNTMGLGAAGKGKTIDTSAIKTASKKITDPATGEGGYTSPNCMVDTTFVFRIIDGSKPVTFNIYESEVDNVEINNTIDETGPQNKATYTKQDNVYASGRVKFMGEYYNDGGSEEETYIVHFKASQDATEDIKTVEGKAGDAIDISDINTKAYDAPSDETYHYTAKWNDTVPSTISGNATYYLEQIPETHSNGAKNYEGTYEGVELGHATHAAAGHYTETCLKCSYTALKEEAALAEHTYGTPEVTLADDGQTITATRVCTIGDGAEDTPVTSEVVDGTQEGKAATCEGYGTKYVRAHVVYSDGTEAYSNEVEVQDSTKTPTGHTYDTENIKWDWDIDEEAATAKAYATYSCIHGDKTVEKEEANVTYVDDTETEVRTFTATITIDGTEYHSTNQAALPHTHIWSTTKEEIAGTGVEADCVTAGGYDIAYVCTKCGKIDEDSIEHVNLGKDPSKHAGPVVDVAAKAETCEEAGYTAGTYCEACKTYVTGHEEIPATGHAYNAPEFVWDDETKTATATQVCANDSSHVYTCKVEMDSEVTTKAKKNTTGIETYYAEATTYNGGTVTETKDYEIAALGVNITAKQANLGKVRFNTGEVADHETKKVNYAYGKTYSVTAIADDGAKFVGWKIGEKIVSTAATYTATAYANTTLQPLFEEETEGNITVIFYDMYGNVLKSFTSIDKETFQANMPAAAPDYPILSGYDFDTWTIDGKAVTTDDFASIAESCSVYATYKKSEAIKYIATITGGTITSVSTGTITDDGAKASDLLYDTKVTVTADQGAEAWKVNGSIVHYIADGETEYSFNIGSNVTIEAVALSAADEVVPTASIINYEKVDGSYKYNIIASTTVPEGYTIVDRGFVYGKELAADELDIDKEGDPGIATDAGLVKVGHAKLNGIDQFSLGYGLSAESGTFRVKAFVTAKDSSGNTEVYYSEPLTITYGA